MEPLNVFILNTLQNFIAFKEIKAFVLKIWFFLLIRQQPNINVSSNSRLI